MVRYVTHVGIRYPGNGIGHTGLWVDRLGGESRTTKEPERNLRRIEQEDLRQSSHLTFCQPIARVAMPIYVGLERIRSRFDRKSGDPDV
jgi:hypothetical protein